MKIIFLCCLLIITLDLSKSDNPGTPPVFWCSNDTLSESYQTTELCAAYKNTVFNKPITITLLYESLCPGCQHMITSILYPNIFQQVTADFVQFEFVPYGNARRTKMENGTWQIDCQHGPNECLMNKFESCAITIFHDPVTWLPFINCVETQLPKFVDNPLKATKICYKTCQIKPNEQKLIEKCFSGDQGDDVIKRMADRTEGVWPEKHKWVPWVMINNVSLHDMQIYAAAGDNFLSFLCNWYRGDKKPQACNEMQDEEVKSFNGWFKG